MTAQKLTSLAISKMLKDDAEDQDMIVQVYDITTSKNGRIICSISDGQYFTKGYCNDDGIIKPGRDQFSIVCIKSHGKMKNNIGITNMKFIGKYGDKLGTPLEWAGLKQNANQIKSMQQFKLVKLIKEDKNQRLNKTEPKKLQLPATAQKTASKDNNYQSIDDLHVGLNRWTILCRITRKSFKQSPKKGTKILQIQLVDKSKKKILGTFFGDAAIDFNDYLKQDCIYEISKGRITQGNYNNSKNDKLSSFAIIFDSKSQFNEVCDVNIISKSQDSAITLGNLYERRTLNQQFDVVAYVVEVKPQTSFQRNDKDFKIKQVVLADPQSKITMSANLWRWNQEFSNQMVGKVVIFSRFVLKQSKSGLNLNSVIRSSIITHHGHAMKKYEDKNIDTSSFTATTEAREKVEENTEDFCYNTNQLDYKIRRMAQGQTIKSVLFVWISRFAFLKKWNYEACPKCKKTAQKYSKCNHCGSPIQQTVLSFMMGVQVSDFNGSIWITMYDDLAKKIFQDMGNTAAKQLQQLSKDQLSEKLQNYAYQPLKLKILTKKDQQGRVRHNAGRFFDLQQQRVARENLKKIYMLMGKSN